MDLLSQRYADPYQILNDFIRTGQLHDFSFEVMQMIAEERVKKSRWEYYLHKIWDMSFEEYVKACEGTKPKETVMQREEAVQIIETSNSILDGFAL